MILKGGGGGGERNLLFKLFCCFAERGSINYMTAKCRSEWDLITGQPLCLLSNQILTGNVPHASSFRCFVGQFLLWFSPGLKGGSGDFVCCPFVCKTAKLLLPRGQVQSFIYLFVCFYKTGSAYVCVYMQRGKPDVTHICSAFSLAMCLTLFLFFRTSKHTLDFIPFFYLGVQG